MRREPHPISGAVYEEIGDGIVRVEDKARGKYGVFMWDGTWLEGDLTYADPHMLVYIGQRDLPPGRDVWCTVMPPENDPDKPLLTPEQEQAMAQMPRIIGAYTPDPGKQTPDGMRSGALIDMDFFVANDRKPERVPDYYKVKSPAPGGPEHVGVDRYFKQEFHDLEVEHIWKKTWQMACREDDIPNIGDYHVYEIASLSFLVVRTGENEFKAHYNACLHRGRRLRERSGKGVTEFICPFHGWSWKHDGTLKQITTEWDFPGIREEVCKLPGAKVATWGGFVFINPDPDAIPLEEYMGPDMIRQYANFSFENRYKHADVTRVVRGNWKLVMEAFMEAYHVIATHPQQLLSSGDCSDTRYDVFGNWARAGNLQVSDTNPLRGMIPTPEQSIESFRRMADFNREFLRPILGDERVDELSDAELVDSSFNNLFPNFTPWGGWGRIVFRFRPHGNNPDESLFDVMLLAPWPADTPRPAPSKHRHLTQDEPFTMAPELGSLAKIIEQDVLNVPEVHIGLKTKQPPHVILSSYQESIVRNFHKNYDRALGLNE